MQDALQKLGDKTLAWKLRNGGKINPFLDGLTCNTCRNFGRSSYLQLTKFPCVLHVYFIFWSRKNGYHSLAICQAKENCCWVVKPLSSLFSSSILSVEIKFSAVWSCSCDVDGIADSSMFSWSWELFFLSWVNNKSRFRTWSQIIAFYPSSVYFVFTTSF